MAHQFHLVNYTNTYGGCMQNLYPIGKDLWVGKTFDGQAKQFKSLPEYRAYLNKLSDASHECPDVSRPIVQKGDKVDVTPFFGFMEFKPQNPVEQAKYSAMSPYWEGTDETLKALNRGLFKTDRQYLS
jgi:hypothetical protein